ncbi:MULTISPECIES: hypothetical protein [Roseivirga]|jgi:hypothetical protein|uniref:Fibrobacter succinogenes major paralogous domain-containing protein n=1 Tax=Roseivirga thermotolerans TaxID=1758176 RepID=A0ABQ3I6Q1_9BACT|nr:MULTISPECIES: hypothetical protein [Roseivirga]MEC7754836.1 hypothetical protein [Bacteroidota bacterium]GHE69088.1 hypothetical protein GCM10011340_26230 [Roseivirga thermotolerans]|tara:strand:+ start:882 stop:1412 length:531 start_codon:yes stop_codon:yes gene_type:complete
MKTLKTFFAFFVSLPLLYLPVELALGEKSADANALTSEQVAFDSHSFSAGEWMTSNLALVNEQAKVSKEHFTYEELETVKPEGWELPTMEQAVSLLKSMGFNQSSGYIPSDYYKVNWQYSGYVDPILGKVNEGEKLLLWVKDNGQHNYISISKDNLEFTPGKTLAHARLSARLVRN